MGTNTSSRAHEATMRQYAVVTHNWPHCKGEFFDTEEEALNNFYSLTNLAAHMIVSPNGQKTEHYGRPDLRWDMLKWWFKQVKPFQVSLELDCTRHVALHGQRYAVVTHNWPLCNGRFFDTEEEAMSYFHSCSHFAAHMVVGPAGQDVAYYGRSDLRSDMLKWWHEELQPISPATVGALESSGRLVTLLPGEEREIKGAVLVLPGGGYFLRDMWKEGYSTAKSLMSAGFAAFVLEYTLEPRQWNGWAKSVMPALREALVAFEIMWQSMVMLGINAPKLFVVGFSAGGHLAMSLCQKIANLPEEFAHLRPSGAVLAYPAVVNPLCSCIYKHVVKGSPLLREYNILQEHNISTDVEHTWCNIDAAALALPKCLVVGSYGDLLLPPSANSDLLVQRLRHHHDASHVEYLCDNYGNHGFVLNGWERELICWLDSQ